MAKMTPLQKGELELLRDFIVDLGLKPGVNAQWLIGYDKDGDEAVFAKWSKKKKGWLFWVPGVLYTHEELPHLKDEMLRALTARLHIQDAWETYKAKKNLRTQAEYNGALALFYAG